MGKVFQRSLESSQQ